MLLQSGAEDQLQRSAQIRLIQRERADISRQLSQLQEQRSREAVLHERRQLHNEPGPEYPTEEECMAGGTYFGEGDVPDGCSVAFGDDPSGSYAAHSERGTYLEEFDESDEETFACGSPSDRFFSADMGSDEDSVDVWTN